MPSINIWFIKDIIFTDIILFVVTYVVFYGLLVYTLLAIKYEHSNYYGF